jgi:hypothetical protein
VVPVLCSKVKELCAVWQYIALSFWALESLLFFVFYIYVCYSCRHMGKEIRNLLWWKLGLNFITLALHITSIVLVAKSIFEYESALWVSQLQFL